MIFKFTKAEKNALAKIEARRETLGKEFSDRVATADTDMPVRMDASFDREMRKISKEISDFLYKCEKKRFDKISQGGTDKILNSAIEQAPKILEYIYKDMASPAGARGIDYLYTEDVAGGIPSDTGAAFRYPNDPELFPKKYFELTEDGGFLIPYDTAIFYIRAGISLHLEALEKYPDAMRALEKEYKRIAAHNKHTINGAYVSLRDPEKIYKPVDKVSSFAWSLIAGEDENGQMTFTSIRTGETIEKNEEGNYLTSIRTSPQRAQNDAFVLLSTNFDRLPEDITKKLTPFDKRVFESYISLLLCGNETFSARAVCRIMGRDTNPNENFIKQVNLSLTKMRGIDIHISNTGEISSGKMKYAKFVYDGSFLPFERITGYIDGKPRDAMIHPLKNPPLLDFAQGRKQITTHSPELFKTPISMTEDNLRLEDYFIEQISHMKNQTDFPRKMRLDTIYKNCGISTKKQRQRAPEKIKKILDHYKKCDFIKTYVLNMGDGFLSIRL